MAYYEYDEFGQQIAYSGPVVSPKTYVGGLGVHDDTADTGLLYMRQRHYDSTLGRFISRDPIGFRGGLNLYGYVGQNPTGFTDPTGFKFEATSDLKEACSQLSDQLGWRGIIAPFEERFQQAIDLALARFRELRRREQTGENTCGCEVPKGIPYEEYILGEEIISVGKSDSTFPQDNKDLAKAYHKALQDYKNHDGIKQATSDRDSIALQIQVCLNKPESIARDLLHELTHIGLNRKYGGSEGVIEKFGTDHPEKMFGPYQRYDRGIECVHF
ncbi:MAG: RHS repeat-associated core domain-containing protein [Vulcanimicrobiota bacterium]